MGDGRREVAGGARGSPNPGGQKRMRNDKIPQLPPIHLGAFSGPFSAVGGEREEEKAEIVD